MDARLITSQTYRDPEIVAAKRAARDYSVRVSPAFEIGGERLVAVIDGHHSYEAARLDGVEPEIIEATVQDDDAVGLLTRGDIEGFLAAHQDGADWRYLDNGQPVW